jgi:hypothetical protein
MRMPKHNASHILHELGRQDEIFEIIDLNIDDPDSRKNFSLMIKRCEDMEIRISSFFNFCEKFNIDVERYEDYEEFKNQLIAMERNSPNEKQFFEKIENEILNDDKVINELMSSYNSISEHLEILREKKAVFSKVYELINGPNPVLKPVKVPDSR